MDTIITTRNTPRLKHKLPGGFTLGKQRQRVRVVRLSPEDLSLQIWKGQTMMSIALTLPEADQLTNALTEITREMWAPK